MGHRELLLTLGALVIFSITSFSINRNMIRNSDASYAQQAQFLAYNQAQELIEKAKTKAFAEEVIKGTVADTSGFIALLGTDVSESYPNQLDDVDDYNNVNVTVADSVIGNTTMTVTVDYVDLADLATPLSQKTFYKLMQVTVTNQYLSNPMFARYIFAYQKN